MNDDRIYTKTDLVIMRLNGYDSAEYRVLTYATIMCGAYEDRPKCYYVISRLNEIAKATETFEHGLEKQIEILWKYYSRE